MDSWTMQNWAVNIIRKWYFGLAAIAVGALLGYGIASIFPAPYRATADLYVGIDITRVNEMEYLIPLAETEPLNLDDYKNWQLKQVAAILSSDPILEATLQELNSKQEVSEFRTHLDLYWFDTGLWKLEVYHPDQVLAQEWAESWQHVGHQRLSEYLEVSREGAELDARLFALADEIGFVKARISGLKSFQSTAIEWMDSLQALIQDQPLNDETRTELEAWVLSYRQNDRIWQVPIGSFPDQNGQVSTYLDWLENSLKFADEDLATSLMVLEDLENERALVLPAYHQSLDDSLGLSANLVLEPINSGVEVDQVRLIGTVVLGGAILGLIFWLVITVVQLGKEDD